MAVWSGDIGFAVTTSDGHDVYTDDIVEKHYIGKALRTAANWRSNGTINDELLPSVRIVIVADAFTRGNIARIKYVRCWGAEWSVTSVDMEHPNIILNLGGVYDGITHSAQG